MIAFESLVNSLPDAVIVLDLQNRVLAASPTVRRLFNLNTGDIAGQSLEQLLPDQQDFVERYARIAAGHTEILVNGHFTDMEISPLKDAADELCGRVVIFRDVTLNKQAENALIATERRYRALFENSNDAIFIIDFSLVILIANERAATLLKVPLDKLVNASARDYFKPEQFTSMEAGIMLLLEREPAPVYEQTLIRPDGVEIPTEVSLTLVRDSHGEPLHIQTILRDISERKQAEKALNARLEQLAVLRQVDEEITESLHIDSVLLVALDAAMRLSRSDAGFIALMQNDEMRVTCLLGKYPAPTKGMVLSAETGVVGRVMKTRRPELIPDVNEDPDYRPDIAKTVAQIVVPLISQDTMVGLLNLETSRKDTFNTDIFEFVQILASRIAVAADNARLYEYVSQQLNETQNLYSRVSRLEQMKTDMIRIASHDLKAPVAIIEGYLDMLKLDYHLFDPLYIEYFDAMQRACARMSQMIADILSLERIQQRATGGTDVLMNVAGMLYRAGEEFQAAADNKHQTLILDIQDDVPALVQGDETQIYEAITNLVSNAIKYTPDGGRITIFLRVTASEVVFKVEDTGYGIPEERQARLFEPFYRARVEGTENIEGTGLGLHLVKNVVERHSGKMLFQSVHGKGSTFGFILPVAK